MYIRYVTVALAAIITGQFHGWVKKVKDRSIPGPRISFGGQIQWVQNLLSKVVAVQ